MVEGSYTRVRAREGARWACGLHVHGTPPSRGDPHPSMFPIGVLRWFYPRGVSEPTASCRECGAPREVPIEGEKACAVCGSVNVAPTDSDTATSHEQVALKARKDQGESVVCNSCGVELDESASVSAEERQPCPQCGSLARAFSVTLKSTVTARPSLGLKAKSGGRGKAFLEQKQGDNYSPSRGRWMRLVQIVDRRRNRYRKLVTDPETGEVLRDVDEPLTDHVGRGDAKRK
jgi:hypothetical protein